MKTIIYASSALPEEFYNDALDQHDKSDQQAQKFNRSVIYGFVQNDCRTYAVSYRKNIIAGHEEKITIHGVEFRLLKEKYKGILNYISVARQSYCTVRKILEEIPDAVVFADGLNMCVSVGAALAARRKGSRSYGIVTDVPGIYNSGFFAHINSVTLKLFSGYVFLTKAMNEVVNVKNKPYAVMEGLYYGTDYGTELSAGHDDVTAGTGKFIVIYAGSLHEQYGVKTMVSAFCSMENKNIELHLYGAGDYAAEIERKCGMNTNIKYYGVKNNAEVVEAEKSADLLINPRSKEEEFTKYSFPSKTIEYMSTGTPVLMQPLPGMPQEYHPYLYLYEGDEPDQLRKAVEKIAVIPRRTLKEKGQKAKAYIMENKNAKEQVSRMMETFT